MKERTINITNHEDDTLVEDKEGKMMEILAKTSNNINLAMVQLGKELHSKNLTEGMKNVYLGSIEGFIMDLQDRLNYEGLLKKRREEIYGDVRSLNDENRELRKQLGEKVSKEDIREFIKTTCDSIRGWWREVGAGHLDYKNTLSFKEYVAIITVSGYIVDHDEDVVGEKIKFLKEIGYDVVDEERYIMLSDKSMQTLLRVVKERFPSAIIGDVKADAKRDGKLLLKSAEIIIRDYNEL